VPAKACKLDKCCVSAIKLIGRQSKDLRITQGRLEFGMKTLTGHFDGKHVVLDEPVTLKPNTKVQIIVPESSNAELVESYARISEPTFHRIWDNPLDAEYDKL